MTGKGGEVEYERPLNEKIPNIKKEMNCLVNDPREKAAPDCRV